ncbi:MAG: hypothetical protein IH944_10625 [Armatimonadetes bacterium]|nr:hypothetical protein [Armatimonadota bacterium]
MPSPAGSGRVWTMAVITAVVVSLFGAGVIANAPAITKEEYHLLGIDRVPNDRSVYLGGEGQWMDVPKRYEYVVWLNGSLQWSNRYYEVRPRLPHVWIEDEHGKRVRRIRTRRVGGWEPHETGGMIGVAIRSDDWSAASSGEIVVARGKTVIARIPLKNSALAVDFPLRSSVRVADKSVVFSLEQLSGNLRMKLATYGIETQLRGEDKEGELLLVVGQASILAKGLEDTVRFQLMLMPGGNNGKVNFDSATAYPSPMALEVTGRIVRGTWERTTLHVDVSSIEILPTLVPEEELSVPRQSLTFPGGSIELQGTSRREVKDSYSQDDHQIGFSLNLRSSFTDDWSAFAHESEQSLVLLAPGVKISTYWGRGIAYYLPGESVLHIYDANQLIEECTHDRLGFDIDVYTVRSREVEDFSLRLKPRVWGY